ncbi:murein L,D-transpeptidase catalytic domain family protein [Parapedobacter tibetensis]|uniref:murein L,D-transpeptidase catalytic domain family protein n=1 Tax=Parapedobacter tibetensis TaxID=2972951 RepID=UPI00214D3BB8|nr:murein L,D-transpeptidase catalytic domain family protein [Parapedobacter tibetensis]
MKVNVISTVVIVALAAGLTNGSCYHDGGNIQAAPDKDTLTTLSIDTTRSGAYRKMVMHHYRVAGLANSGLDSAVFYTAYTGYLNLKAKGRTTSPILTIVDFNLPSTTNRMWIIDADKDSLLLSTWSAHGKGSGTEMAAIFSNIPGSLQTSLGFYLTAEEYIGKNGRSLKLDGLDVGYNTNARKRYVVMHGADYVSQDTIDAYGHLGNSEGCPAVSHDVNHQVIDWVKGRSVLFIIGPSKDYHSVWLDEEVAMNQLLEPRNSD